MDKKKFWIFPFVLCLLATLFTLGLNRSSAETSTVSVTGKFADTITSVNVTNNEGGDLTWELEQWATFRINATYDLAGKNVKAGDTTVVTVPDALIISSDSFEMLTPTRSSLMQPQMLQKNRFPSPIQTMLKNTLTQTAPSSSMHGLISRSTLKKEKSRLKLPLTTR